MTGIKAKDMIAKGDYEYAVPFCGERRQILIDLVFAGDDKLIQKQYSHIRKEGNVLIADTTLPRPTGRRHVLMGSTSPMYDTSGRLMRAINAGADFCLQNGGMQKQEE